jgi:hypothetical protein
MWPFKSSGFRPDYPRHVSRSRLISDASWFFSLPPATVREKFSAYQALHKSKRYKKLLGEEKTLCFPEAFIVYVGLSIIRPAIIVEIGTQYGNSTRRILDMRDALGLKSRVICFDIMNELKFCRLDEVELILSDITGRFRERVLDAYHPEFIFLDARPYHLLNDVVGEFLKFNGNAMLAIHDCGRGLCNPQMVLGKDDLAISSATGIWERHVLAERFGIHDPLSGQLDRIETATHRLNIFQTPNGLAAIAPRRIVTS